MILDTTYLLPLARIRVSTDLLLAIAEKRTRKGEDILSFSNFTISLISIFELQAKAAKLGVKPEYVLDAISAIGRADFRIEPYYSPGIIESSFNLKSTGIFSDYIDCIIVATALELKEELISEDSRIHRRKKVLQDRFGLKVYSYKDFLIPESQKQKPDEKDRSLALRSRT